MTNKKLTADKIKKVRKAFGWSLQQLKDATGLSRTYLNELENGIKPITENVESLINDAIINHKKNITQIVK